MKEFLKYGKDIESKKRALFASVFVLQNRLQTAGEKIQTEISMRQWLLLAMTEICVKPRTLTNIGNLMGCSRQNVKKLALALNKKGFIEFEYSSNNSVVLVITKKAENYLAGMAERHIEVLSKLFSEFSEEEVSSLFLLQDKMLNGLERVEDYAHTIGKEEEK